MPLISATVSASCTPDTPTPSMRSAEFAIKRRISTSRCHWKPIGRMSTVSVGLGPKGALHPCFIPTIEREQVLSSGHERALFVVAASTFFVFFKPLATIVPRLDPLHWLRSLDRG